MKQAGRQKETQDSSFGDKLLRSAQQARDWVQGKPVRVRVTYVPAPQVDVRELRGRMRLSQTQFTAKWLVLKQRRLSPGDNVDGVSRE